MRRRQDLNLQVLADTGFRDRRISRSATSPYVHYTIIAKNAPSAGHFWLLYLFVFLIIFAPDNYLMPVTVVVNALKDNSADKTRKKGRKVEIINRPNQGQYNDSHNPVVQVNFPFTVV